MENLSAKGVLPLFHCRLRGAFIIILLFIATASAPSLSEAGPKRIISVTPVGTEILFALGQGQNIAGVTSFCDYPPEALKKPKIGGYSDINFEALVAQRVDLVVLQDMHSQSIPDLEKLKIPYFVVKQENISDIYKAVDGLGKICGASKKAELIVAGMKKDIAAISKKVNGRPRPSVLLCVSRELSGNVIPAFYAAGTRNFYNEVISLAGGENVMGKTKSVVTYHKISQEGLALIDPNVIVDLVGEAKYYHSADKIDINKVFNEKYLKGQWLSGVKVKAVRDGRIYIMDGTVFLRPGPRLPFIIKSFAKALHPEVKW
ncbi:MAG: ABC transporter substrate-binding protein [Cloacibacillus sp.]